MSDTLDKVRELISKEFQLDRELIRPETSLVDLGVDSLAALEFAFELETAFGITLDQSADLRGATVQDVVDVVEAARAQGSRATPAVAGSVPARSAAD
jgi:acyl carrier protein